MKQRRALLLSRRPEQESLALCAGVFALTTAAMVNQVQETDYSSAWKHTLEEDGSVVPPPLPPSVAAAGLPPILQAGWAAVPCCLGLLLKPAGPRQHPKPYCRRVKALGLPAGGSHAHPGILPTAGATRACLPLLDLPVHASPPVTPHPPQLVQGA